MRYLKKKSRKNSRGKNKNYTKRYKCVKLTRRNKKYKGGAVTTSAPSSPSASLPMVIDKNNIAYSCTPIPNN